MGYKGQKNSHTYQLHLDMTLEERMEYNCS